MRLSPHSLLFAQAMRTDEQTAAVVVAHVDEDDFHNFGTNAMSTHRGTVQWRRLIYVDLANRYLIMFLSCSDSQSVYCEPHTHSREQTTNTLGLIYDIRHLASISAKQTSRQCNRTTKFLFFCCSEIENWNSKMTKRIVTFVRNLTLTLTRIDTHTHTVVGSQSAFIKYAFKSWNCLHFEQW